MTSNITVKSDNNLTTRMNMFVIQDQPEVSFCLTPYVLSSNSDTLALDGSSYGQILINVSYFK